MKRLLPVIVVFLLFNSCFDQNDCLITSTNLVKINLVTKAGVAMTARFTLVQQDSLGPDHNSKVELKYFEGAPVGVLDLPLDPENKTSYYSFTTSDSINFKLGLQYTTFSRVISTDCGAFLYYKDLSVLPDATNFDSTRVIESQLFKSVTTNLKVFF